MDEKNKNAIIAVRSLEGGNLGDLLSLLTTEEQKEISKKVTEEIVKQGLEHKQREEKTSSGLKVLSETINQIESIGNGVHAEASGKIETGSGHITFKIKKGKWF